VENRHLHLSAVTLGEIQAGIEITREQDPHKAAEIEAWADRVAATWNILAMDGAAFRLWGRLMHRRPDRLIEDAMIAATARLHGLTLVTRNVKDFREFEVNLLNPFAAR
jgi:predicted nucleic acid-binding protein